MRVNGHAVGLLNPTQQCLAFIGQHGAAGPRRVHMQVCTEVARDGGNARQIIDCAVSRRACGRNHEHWIVSGIRGHEAGQRLATEAHAVAGRHQTHRVAAKPGAACDLDPGKVSLGRHVDRRSCGDATQSVFRPFRVTPCQRSQQGRVIGFAATAGEGTAHFVRRPADARAECAQQLAFDLNRGRSVAAHRQLRVDRRRDQIARDGRRQRRRVEQTEVTRMITTNRMRTKQLEHFGSKRSQRSGMTEIINLQARVHLGVRCTTADLCLSACSDELRGRISDRTQRGTRILKQRIDRSHYHAPVRNLHRANR